jgi:hypothetical protein
MNWTAESINEILLRAESEDKGKGKGKRAVPSVDQGSRISPVGALSSLVMDMQGEVHEFAFGYLPMHQMSWKILRAIRTQCEPYLKATYGSDFTLKECEPPFMVGHILPLADNGPITMLRIAGKLLDLMNDVDSSSIGTLRMYELNGIIGLYSEEHKQIFRSLVNAQRPESEEKSEEKSEEESDDEKFFGTRHVVNLETGQVKSRRVRYNITPSTNQQLEE